MSWTTVVAFPCALTYIPNTIGACFGQTRNRALPPSPPNLDGKLSSGPTLAGPEAGIHVGRIASTSSPVQSSKPARNSPCGQRPVNLPPPSPPIAGSIVSVCACADRTRNNVDASIHIKRPGHFNRDRTLSIEWFINLLLLPCRLPEVFFENDGPTRV